MSPSLAARWACPRVGRGGSLTTGSPTGSLFVPAAGAGPWLLSGLNVQSGHCKLPAGGEQCSTGTGATEKVARKVCLFAIHPCAVVSQAVCGPDCNGPGTFGGHWRCGCCRRLCLLLLLFVAFVLFVLSSVSVVVVVCCCFLWGPGFRLVPLVLVCLLFLAGFVFLFSLSLLLFLFCCLFLVSLGAGLFPGWFPLFCCRRFWLCFVCRLLFCLSFVFVVCGGRFVVRLVPLVCPCCLFLVVFVSFVVCCR